MRVRRFYIINMVVTAIAVALLVKYSAWCFVLVLVISVSVIFFGCINLSWNFFTKTYCNAGTTEKIIALTFDDGPAQYTASILDTLKQHDAPAAFFCIGKNIAGNEHILQRINEEGHIIGNHSYSHHFWFDMWGAVRMQEDMRGMDNEVFKVTGLNPLLFRPPYGVINPRLAHAIERGKYTSLGWSVRSFDTRIKDKQKLLSHIMKQVRPGGIILLHDSMEITAAILPELIEQIKSSGYSITRLDKMLNIDAYA